MFETLRYFAALGLLLTVPGAALSWLLVHPFIAVWRRIGPARTYVALAAFKLLLAVAAFLLRRPLLEIEFGFRPALAALGVGIGILGIALERARRRELPDRAVQGLAELTATPGAPGELATGGIYARLRHPRYVAVVLNLTAWALITDFLAVYALVGLTVVAVLIIVPLEERELTARFGDAYRRYRELVPAFVPRRW